MRAGAHHPQPALRHGPSRLRAQPEGALPPGADRHAHTTQNHETTHIYSTFIYKCTDNSHLLTPSLPRFLCPFGPFHPPSLLLSPSPSLTGTPIQNHVMDVWSVMQFLVPDYLGERSLTDRLTDGWFDCLIV